ncbi:TonB-linked outer membrane protein, SusC/RagA family [Reichenbachiella agariperforans]|uniref:TonB-linked outer membrane protein, SusC/RagA family n=1 Tax=Reichenbachiella agariperforans TaxID=156994 RepID=A0A1M6RS78_REIAG|nr:TonB-dependent receptor [Reichenbachiella agariperforans]SHK35198.1 TonB-linked outer membrane protein, SusC/RagA family [Reichenbachiella agariperforans]
MKRLLLLKSKYMAVIAMCLLSFWASAQTTVTGVVTSSEDGESVPGATVLVKGTTNGTITDLDGKYSLSVPESATLVVSFVGFEQQEVAVGSRSVVDVSLNTDYKQLEEVVVVGYGTVKKSDNTGALSSVKSEELNAFPTLSAVQGLQGRAAGVQIQSTNGGQPGAEMNMRIRGGSSINASSNPLVVVDGFVGGEMPPPADISSMEVLKDASATAIYGSRAANGVILVTTKSGGAGKTKVDVNSSYSYQETSNRLDLLSGEDYRDYILEVVPAYSYDATVDTDWQDEIFRPGHIWNNQVSVSGGSEAVKYYVSGTQFEQEGVIDNSNYERFSVTSNLNIKASDRVTIGMNLYGRRSIDQGVLTQETTGGSSSTGVVGAAARLEPDTPVRDADGNYTQSKLGDNIDNPVAIANEIDRERVTDRFQSNGFVDFKLLDWLSFKTTLGAGVTSYREGMFSSSDLVRGGGSGVATLEFDKATNLLTENYFTINKEFGIHRINWVNGYSFQKRVDEGLETGASDFLSEATSYWLLESGAASISPVSAQSTRILKSYYSRANYTLLDRYVFTATIRYDGASNFAKNNKWAYFPSGAVAWNIGDEPFLESINTISDMKIRASYGLTGNQGIGAYESLSTVDAYYSNRPGQGALILGTLANPDLTWETTAQLDIGIDVGLFDNRVRLTADYYDKQTSDLLFDRPIPAFFGVNETVPTQLQNYGEIRNQGIEAMLTTRNLVGDLTWTSNLVFSMNRNEVTSLPDTATISYYNAPGHFNITSGFQLLQEGQSMGVYYGYVYEGVTQPGDVLLVGSDEKIGGEQFADLNGDGELTDEDKKIIGNPHPDFIWSFNNDFTYKNFDLNVYIQGVHGNEMLNLTRMELESFRGTNNVSTAALDRYHVLDNPSGTIPSADPGRTQKISSRWVEDGSYVRLKNVALGYTIPQSVLEKIRVRSLRVYVSAQNLFTITNYSGLDPEAAYANEGEGTNNADSNRNLGLDYASYPNVKTYTVGLNLGF